MTGKSSLGGIRSTIPGQSQYTHRSRVITTDRCPVERGKIIWDPVVITIRDSSILPDSITTEISFALYLQFVKQLKMEYAL